MVERYIPQYKIMNINNEKRDQDSRSGTRYLIFFNEKSKLDLLIYGLNGVK